MIRKLLSILKFNRRVVGAGAVATTTFLVLVYIATVNGVATAGFEVSNMEKEIALLKKERAALQLEVSAIGSLQKVEVESRSLSLTPVSEIEYLSTTSAVAIR